jgi:hypothetical protein
MQVPHVIHRLFYDRDYPSVMPTRWTCEPHIVTLRDRSGTVACPQGGWMVRAWCDGFADPAIGYVMVDRYGTSVDYSPLPDPHPQPFETGPERVHDSGWWRPLAISLADWNAFVAACGQPALQESTPCQ